LWKALKLYAGDVHARSAKAIGGQRTLEQIFAEYQAEG
jgi:hypothetical protein